MTKMHIILASTLVVFCLSSASFKIGLIDNQFALKSLNENTLQDHLSHPLKIHTRVIEESFSDETINKAISSTLSVSAKIISDLLLINSPTEKISIGEKIKCDDALLSHIFHSENFEEDIAIFAISDVEKDEIITSKKCEANSNKFIKAIALEINVEKFRKLEKISQVREICIEIANVLYGDKEERQVLVGEIDEYLAKEMGKLEAGSCISGQYNCIKCANQNDCLDCASGYYPQAEHCSFCPSSESNIVCAQCDPQCISCDQDAYTCRRCVDTLHMTPAPNCICPTNSVIYRSACVCNKGYYFSSNTVCSACKSNCATCSGSSGNCITCSDPFRMSAAPACACPANTHILAGKCVSSS